MPIGDIFLGFGGRVSQVGDVLGFWRGMRESQVGVGRDGVILGSTGVGWAKDGVCYKRGGGGMSRVGIVRESGVEVPGGQ